MAKQRRSAPAKSAPTERKGGGKPAGDGDRSKEADAAAMIQDGNRPHESTLHGTELEDFGLDVLPVIQPRKA